MSGSEEDESHLDGKRGVYNAVKALMVAVQHLQEDPASIIGVETLIDRLKTLLHQEKKAYTLTHQNSEKRKKIESLHNLIEYLQQQVHQARHANQRHGVKYYLARISNSVMGHEVGRISQSMESKLQSWLELQGIHELVEIINEGSEDDQVKAISSFEVLVRKGYDASLQDTILSAGLVDILSMQLKLDTVPWSVKKEATFALIALVDFNKDIFVSLILMSKVVENLLNLMDSQFDQSALFVVCVLKSLISAGETVVVDEIYAQDGIPRLVKLLDHKSQSLQHAAMDCIFQLTFHGRMEVVEKMLELKVVSKLAILQHDNILQNSGKINRDAGVENLKQMHGHTDSSSCPFADALTRFALHLATGTGLRKRERRALKQQFLKEIKEVIDDDVEVANITAEVLWAP